MLQINWTEYWTLVLGGMTVTKFFAFASLMSAGAFVYFVLDVNQSVATDSHTPDKFKFWFMVKDNIPRGVGVLIAICASVIWFESFYGVPINAKLSFTAGLSIDALIGQLLKTRKTFLRNKNGRRNGLILN